MHQIITELLIRDFLPFKDLFPPFKLTRSVTFANFYSRVSPRRPPNDGDDFRDVCLKNTVSRLSCLDDPPEVSARLVSECINSSHMSRPELRKEGCTNIKHRKSSLQSLIKNANPSLFFLRSSALIVPLEDMMPYNDF